MSVVRLPAIVVRVSNDVTGKPYVTIEGDDPGDPAPVKLLLYADEITVQDVRR